jgi:two-component system OmpR family response regulator
VVLNGYRFDGSRLEHRSRRLVGLNEKPVSLSKGEYALLMAFLEAPQRPFLREHLLQATRVHQDIFDRSIDVAGRATAAEARRSKSAASHPDRSGIGYV